METSNQWTVDTLHEHFTKCLEMQDTRYQQRYDAQEKAVELAVKVAAQTVTSEYRDLLNTRLGEITEQLHKTAGESIVHEKLRHAKNNTMMLYALLGSGLLAAIIGATMNHLFR